MKAHTKLSFLVVFATFVIMLSAQTRDVLHFEDFEMGAAGWTFNGQFEINIPSHSNYCNSAHSGIRIMGSNLAGDYLPNQAIFSNYAQSPVINCEGAENLKVAYWSYSRFHGYGYDIGHLYLKVDEGAWTLIDKVEDVKEDKWTKHYLDISDLADGHLTIQFRFTYLSNDLIELTGWNIDDFTVLEAAPFTGTMSINPSGFEGGGNYTSFSTAIDAINLHGIGAGGLTVNVTVGSVFNEDPPALVASGRTWPLLHIDQRVKDRDKCLHR